TRWPRDWSSDVCSSDLRRKVIRNHLHIGKRGPAVDLARIGVDVGRDALARPVEVIRAGDVGRELTGKLGRRRLWVGRQHDSREVDRKSTRLNSSHVAIS